MGRFLAVLERNFRRYQDVGMLLALVVIVTVLGAGVYCGLLFVLLDVSVGIWAHGLNAIVYLTLAAFGVWGAFDKTPRPYEPLTPRERILVAVVSICVAGLGFCVITLLIQWKCA